MHIRIDLVTLFLLGATLAMAAYGMNDASVVREQAVKRGYAYFYSDGAVKRFVWKEPIASATDANFTIQLLPRAEIYNATR